MPEHLPHMFGALGPMPSKYQNNKAKTNGILEEKHTHEHTHKKKNPSENCVGHISKFFL